MLWAGACRELPILSDHLHCCRDPTSGARTVTCPGPDAPHDAVDEAGKSAGAEGSSRARVGVCRNSRNCDADRATQEPSVRYTGSLTPLGFSEIGLSPR